MCLGPHFKNYTEQMEKLLAIYKKIMMKMPS